MFNLYCLIHFYFLFFNHYSVDHFVFKISVFNNNGRLAQHFSAQKHNTLCMDTSLEQFQVLLTL